MTLHADLVVALLITYAALAIRMILFMRFHLKECVWTHALLDSLSDLKCASIVVNIVLPAVILWILMSVTLVGLDSSFMVQNASKPVQRVPSLSMASVKSAAQIVRDAVLVIIVKSA